MALLAPHAGDLSGAESPPQPSHLLDGVGAGWLRGGGSFGGGSIAGAGTIGPATMPPLSVPPLAAHQISVGEDEEDDNERTDGGASDSSDSGSDGGASGATSASSVFTLCNSAIGAGVLSLPFAFRRAGLGGGLALCAAVGSVEAFTLYVISKFAERYEARSYGQLVRRALGRKLALSLRLVLSSYLCGSCVAYMVIVGDCFTPLLSSLAERLGGGRGAAWSGVGAGGGGGLPPPPPPPSLFAVAVSFPSPAPPSPSPPPRDLVDRAHVIWAAAALVAYPLCLPRTLGALAKVSAAAVAGFAVTAAAIVARGLEAVSTRGRHHRWDGMTGGARTDYGALFAIPIVVFGFNCHANVVSVFTELERHPEVFGLPSSPAAFASWSRNLPSLFPVPPAPRTRKLIGMLGVIATAVAVIALGYISVGVAGYAAFPTTVGGNVLNSFSEGDGLMQAVRGVVGGVVLAHYPLNHHPARAAAEDIFRSVTKRRASKTGSALGTALFVSLSAAVAVAVPDLGSVLHLVGGTAAAFIIFFLPGLLLINAAIVKHTAESASGSFADLQTLVEGGATGEGAEERGENGGGGGLRASLLPSAAAAAAAARRRAAARRARRAAVAATRKASAATGSSSSSSAVAAAAAAEHPSPLRRASTASGGGGEDAGFELGGEGLGIKRVGLIYSPRRSWWSGVALVTLAVAIWTVTIVTAVVPYRE